MEDKSDAKTSETRELWGIEQPYPWRNRRSECRMRGQSTSEGNSVSPDRSRKNFRAADELLSNSVYLWACDESTSGITPSRSDAYVGWVILIIQMACYIQLILVSSGKPQQDLSSSTEGRYSIVSVAVAMYLMISIAAVDLTAGIALLIEGRSIRSVCQRGANESVQEMNGVRWLQRKVVGLTLISSFGLLTAASITVLFKSSSEDVDLVVGAAAVLFIADVDEKVMFVLTIIPSEWRLFCVLEAVGLSVDLALLALRVTGNVARVRGDGHAGCMSENEFVFRHSCDIYGWNFILAVHPLSVTIISLLLNTIVASPKRFFEKHVLESNSLQNWAFVFVLASWILEAILVTTCGLSYHLMISEIFWYYIFSSCYVLFYFVYWAAYIIQIGIRLGSGLPIPSCRSVRRCSANTPLGRYLVPACLSLMVIILATAVAINVDPSEDFIVAVLTIEEIFYELIGMWFLWGIFRRGNSVKDEAHETPVSAIGREPGAESYNGGPGKRFKLTKNLILGWMQAEALFITTSLVVNSTENTETAALVLEVMSILVWIGVGFCAVSSNEKGIAFWTVATLLLPDVFSFIASWASAKSVGSVE